MEIAKSWRASRDDYRDTLISTLARFPEADILELGGGRRPSFSLSEMPANVRSYTVNDVSEAELSLAPPEYKKACFDVSGDATAFTGQFDFVFSRFLAEHVADGKALHRNVFDVLKPGGIAFHLIPTLYASPFIVNRFLPEAAGRRILSKFFPYRKDKSPKFPAYYSYCEGDTPRMRRLFSEIGYSALEIRSFYGHYYYDKVPGLREIENAISSLAAKNDWTWYSSYAFILAQK
jgi:SAM-dependent methyltransferase